MCFPVLTNAQSLARGTELNTVNIAVGSNTTISAAPAFGGANAVSSTNANGGGINATVQFYPNPFASTLNVAIGNNDQNAGSKLYIYNAVGELLMSTILNDMVTSYQMNNFPNGVYYYKVIRLNGAVQAGKLLAKHQN